MARPLPVVGGWGALYRSEASQMAGSCCWVVLCSLRQELKLPFAVYTPAHPRVLEFYSPFAQYLALLSCLILPRESQFEKVILKVAEIMPMKAPQSILSASISRGLTLCTSLSQREIHSSYSWLSRHIVKCEVSDSFCSNYVELWVFFSPP